MESVAESSNQGAESLRSKVRNALIWRSGSQIAAQLIQWLATFLVIRILDPRDYGLYSMTQVILVLLTMLNGYGLASGLVQQKTITPRQVSQLFGMLLLVNGALAAVQIAGAPLAAAYYRQPLVTDMLRVQALLYVTTPFIAIPYALLAREMDFRKQAKVNISSSVASASTALGGALAGLGVWTLVLAPLVFFATRAIGMMIAARWLVRPSFDFRGTGGIMRYGALMTLGSFFWFIESQADIFIGGRWFSAHELGLYSTALFLTQIFVSKFVPPLNEVAFSAYARIQHDKPAVALGFTRQAGAIMLAAMPFYLGLATTAAPLVETVLGDKWLPAAPIVRLLALGMPFMTIQVLFAPACEALGRPGIGVENGATGGVILGIAFLIGVQWGPIGLAGAWVAAYPLYLAISMWRSLPVLGVSLRALAAALLPSVAAAIAMAGAVLLIDHLLPPLDAPVRLAILVIGGAAAYAGLLFAFARRRIADLIALLRRESLTAVQTA
jgi:O-antigen/teichoic acid export membrane protein